MAEIFFTKSKRSIDMKVTDTLKKNIEQCITDVVYTYDAKPRLTFTDGSPLEKKIAILNDGTANIIALLEKDNSRNLLREALNQLQEWRPDCLEDDEIVIYDETIASIEDYLK